jgi:tRNA(fMet)-specific endonuclease VapC
VKYLLDTDWLIDVFAGVPPAVQALQDVRPQGVGVSIISHAEIFEGAYAYPDIEAHLISYREFLAQIYTVPLAEPIMEVFGRTRSTLRRAGQLIPDLDLLIAATAVHHDLDLMTRNRRHFARVPALRLYPPN